MRHIYPVATIGNAESSLPDRRKGRAYCKMNGLKNALNMHKNSPAISPRHRLACTVVRDTLNWIDGRYDTDLHIQSVIEHSGYTKWHFQRLFRQVTGITIKDYIQCRRLELAVCWLTKTDLSLFDVASRSGFSGPQQLTRAMKRYQDTTPSEIRVQYRNAYEHDEQAEV